MCTQEGATLLLPNGARGPVLPELPVFKGVWKSTILYVIACRIPFLRKYFVKYLVTIHFSLNPKLGKSNEKYG